MEEYKYTSRVDQLKTMYKATLEFTPARHNMKYSKPVIIAPPGHIHDCCKMLPNAVSIV